MTTKHMLGGTYTLDTWTCPNCGEFYEHAYIPQSEQYIPFTCTRRCFKHFDRHNQEMSIPEGCICLPLRILRGNHRYDCSVKEESK